MANSFTHFEIRTRRCESFQQLAKLAVAGHSITRGRDRGAHQLCVQITFSVHWACADADSQGRLLVHHLTLLLPANALLRL